MSTTQTPQQVAGSGSPRTLSLPRGRSLPRSLIALARPGQWAKNPAVVLLPVLTVPRLTLPMALSLGWSTGLFILASVATYTLNDLRDRDRDRLHPGKRSRPLAAGELSPGAAVAFLVTVATMLAAGLVLLHLTRTWPVGAYFLLNLAYSFRLKHVAILDALAVATGFVLRALQGYVALHVQPSPWLLLAVLTICLVFVLGKRRRELAGETTLHRPVLRGYSVQLLDYMLLISATLAGTSYLLFLRSEISPAHTSAALMVLSVPCALFALFRYLQLLIIGGHGGDPTRTLFGDRQLLICALIWLAIVICVQIFRLPAG